MDRRTFLALMATPALVPLVQSCSSNDTEGDGFDLVSSSRARAATSPNDAFGAARAVNELAADLYGRMLPTSGANMVFSPASIMLALAMTRAGASGATASEMDEVLHSGDTGSTASEFHRAINSLSTALESRSGTFEAAKQEQVVELSIANSLWGQSGFTWEAEFLDVLARDYGTGVRVVDFVNQTEDVRRAINGWVSRETKGRIPELLERGTLTPDIALSLVNAIYLKAAWLQPFPETGTVDGPFMTVDETRVVVPVMHMTLETGYIRGEGWQSVVIPYVGGSLEMVLIVPDAGALTSVEAQVGSGLIDAAVDGPTSRSVNLGLPRFDIESKSNLSKVMAALGMPTAFDPSTADFSAMTKDERLFISFIIHQANITVDEIGTEAAAATAVGMGRTSAPFEPVSLEIDRPFLFALRDNPTGAVLFLGRVGDPR